YSVVDSFVCYLQVSDLLLYLLFFPTRRSSDLLSKPLADNGHELVVYNDGKLDDETLKTRIKDAEVIVIANTVLKGEVIDAAEKRSEEHTSELQSRFDLVCRLLLEKKNEHD